MQTRWIWPFKLDEKIGEGGMGVVYRARYARDDRPVAVKLFPDDVDANETLVARFEREMEVLKGLRHPHIVHCFGGVCEDDRRFYAMELVQGGSVASLLRERGHLAWEQVIEYGLQLCAALAYAHRRGLVHRDIKPSNLLLTEDGKLKLSDFGLAYVASARKLTATAKTVGTFPYMSPEQIRSDLPMTPRSDLYSMGCVFFEMLAGRPPFRGETAAEIMHHHLETPAPRVSAHALDCPPQLENLIAQLLEKDPDNRPPGAAAVAAALQQTTQTVTVSHGAPEQGVGNRPVRPATERAKEDKPAATPRSKWSALPANGLVAGCVAVMLLLLVWNLSLMNQDRLGEQSERLWTDALQSEHVPVRLEAVRALGELGQTSDTAVAALTEGLSDENPLVRERTIAALEKLGARASPAVPDLLRVRKFDADSNVRDRAVVALRQIRDAEPAASSSWWYGVLAVGLIVLIGGVVVAQKKMGHRQSEKEGADSPRTQRGRSRSKRTV